jgi:hypothetical protein
MQYPDSPGEDQIEWTPERFAVRFRISSAFLNLVLKNGCPTSDGKITEESFFRWLEEHYEELRAAAGLPPLPPLSDNDPLWLRSEKRKRAFLTILEFTESRSFSPATRRELHEASRKLMEN